MVKTKLHILSPDDYKAKCDAEWGHMAKSADPEEAATGRLMLKLAPFLREWMDGEEGFGTPPGDAIVALGKSLAREIAAWTLTMAPDGHRKAALNNMTQAVTSYMRSIADAEELDDIEDVVADYRKTQIKH